MGMRGMATPVDIPFNGGPPPGNGDFAFEVGLIFYTSPSLIYGTDTAGEDILVFRRSRRSQR